MQNVINQHAVLDGKFSLELKSYIGALSLYLEKRKQRQQLLQLDDYLLKDIGVSRQQAINEANQ